MAFKLETAVRNAMAQALIDAIGASCKIHLYTGPEVALSQSVPSGQIVATLTGNAAGFAGAPSNGIITASPITKDDVAVGGADAQFVRIETSGGTQILNGSVSATGGGGDLEINNVTIQAGADVIINDGTFTITMGNA